MRKGEEVGGGVELVFDRQSESAKEGANTNVDGGFRHTGDEGLRTATRGGSSHF